MGTVRGLCRLMFADQRLDRERPLARDRPSSRRPCSAPPRWEAQERACAIPSGSDQPYVPTRNAEKMTTEAPASVTFGIFSLLHGLRRRESVS